MDADGEEGREARRGSIPPSLLKLERARHLTRGGSWGNADSILEAGGFSETSEDLLAYGRVRVEELLPPELTTL